MAGFPHRLATLAQVCARTVVSRPNACPHNLGLLPRPAWRPRCDLVGHRARYFVGLPGVIVAKGERPNSPGRARVKAFEVAGRW